jgi:hypothetical protein
MATPLGLIQQSGRASGGAGQAIEYTYESTATTSGEDCRLPVEMYKKAGPFLTLPLMFDN